MTLLIGASTCATPSASNSIIDFGINCDTKFRVSTTGSDNRPVRTEVKARLYVTIDGLNMRTGPHLDSAVVEKFPLFEEVIFMDEYTDFTQELSLGKETANEPWIKVKSKRGKTGWVWGAGVDYRRKKREGVQ